LASVQGHWPRRPPSLKDRIIAAYPRVFDDTIRPMHGSPYKIPFVPGAKLPPRIVPNIRYTYHREQAAMEEVQTQLREGIISKWEDYHPQDQPPPTSTDGFFVAKKDPSKACLVQDYVRLNNVTERHIFSTPSAEHQVTDLDPSFKYFAVVDCTKGFHQVDLAEESKPFTAFTIYSPAAVAGTYFLNRLPMGLKGATDAHDHRITGAISNVTDRLLHEDGLVGLPTVDGLERKLLAVAQRCNEHDISLSRQNSR
jgi:hypothetical protein